MTTALSADLSDDDLRAFIASAGELRTDPLVFVQPLNNESGLHHEACNRQTGKDGMKHAVAGGIFQALDSTLRAIGFVGGVEAFCALSFQDQLPFLVKYYKAFAGKMQTAVQVYAVTFTPGLFAHYSNPDFVICAKDGSSGWGQKPAASQLWYAQNAGLDKDHDGVITPKDLAVTIAQANATPRAKEIAQRLRDLIA